jgi:hypothetical protein
MFVAAELAHGDEGVHVMNLPVEKTRVPPQLWWTGMVQDASQAFTRGACFAVVTPQHMTGANQPMLVGHV